jgi:hypothetical protein
MPRYREVPQAPEFKEGEKIPETKVVLHFLRHEEKEPAKPGQPDVEAELTLTGKKKAIQQGKEKPAKPQVAWAAGSPRIRSAHTVLLRMMAGKESITQEMTFVEAKAEAERELKYGKKVTSLSELNFYWEGTPEFNKTGMEAYKAGHGLEWLLKESDGLAVKLKDKDSSSYSRVAANYASLIAREMRVGNNFNRIVTREPDKYKQYGNQLERYFGTHQTISECFYMKVLEKFYGREKAEEFIESFRDEKGRADGFGFQEGFKIEIKNGPEGQKIVLEGVRGFPDMELTPQLLRDIVDDAVKLDEEIEKKV